MRPRRRFRARFSFPQLIGALAALIVLAAGARTLFRADGSAEERPTPAAPSSSHVSPLPAPACAYGSAAAPHASYGEWRRTLVDRTLRLTPAYAPPDLVPVLRSGFHSDLQVRRLVIADLAGLRHAAAANGARLGILAAYRSYGDQQRLFEQRVRALGYEAARVKTARPGHSEHQLGTTIDFRSAGERDVHIDWESTPAGAWIAANGWKFGFVQSYPRGDEDLTCYSYEPWHYRYFGRPLARRIHESGLTTREFLWNAAQGAA